MALGTALKKINARAKQLRKKHPGAKYSTLQKQAGKEFKAGKLKAKRKPAKKKAVRKKSARQKLVTKTKVIYRVVRPRKKGKHHKATVIVKRNKSVSGIKRRKRAAKKVYSRRRVSGTGSSMLLPIAVLGIGGILAYMLLKPSTPTSAYVVPTGDPTRDNQAAQIMAWATAAGIAGNIAINLINALNTKSSAEVSQMYNAVQAGQDPTAFIAGVYDNKPGPYFID